MIETQAYVLHIRPFSDSRFLVDFLTEKQGVRRCLIRMAKNRLTKPALFSRYWLRYTSQAKKLPLIYTLELEQAAYLYGQRLFCGFYLNELLLKCLPAEFVCIELFELYQSSITQLGQDKAIEPLLRRFELMLLEEAGSGLSWTVDVNMAQIQAESQYYFVLGKGFIPITANGHSISHPIFGKTLHFIAQRDFDLAVTRQVAKNIIRVCIDELLCGKSLKSRALFKKEIKA